MLCTIQVIRLTEKVPHLFSSAKVSRLDKTLKKCEVQYDRLIKRENEIAE